MAFALLGLCRCWRAVPAVPDSPGSSCRDSRLLVHGDTPCCLGRSCGCAHSLPEWGMHSRDKESLIAKGCEIWFLLSPVSTPPRCWQASSKAGSCLFFFKKRRDFWCLHKTTDLNVFVFQYTSSPSDCNMNPEDTKSREANNHNSSCTAIETSEFVRDSWVRKGKGAKLWLCCLVFVSEGCFGLWLPKFAHVTRKPP